MQIGYFGSMERSRRVQFITRLSLAGLLSGGVFFLQLGFAIFSLRSTFLEFVSDESERNAIETPISWLAVISTAYAIFFTFYMSVFFKLKLGITDTTEQDANQVADIHTEVISKYYRYGVHFFLLTELLNLLFSSYLISSEIASKKSNVLIYTLFTYTFVTNCISFRAFTYDLAYKNAEYFYIRFRANGLDRKKFMISVLISILTTLSQCIAVNFFSTNAYKVFPLTQNFSKDLAKTLAIGMSILYFPFGFLLGSVQTYRFLMGEEAYSGTLDSLQNARCSKTNALKATHILMQGSYIGCRSFITLASIIDLIKQLDPNQTSNGLKIGCAVPIVMSYAAYEYFLMCRSVNHFSHRFFSSNPPVHRQHNSEDVAEARSEMRLIA